MPQKAEQLQKQLPGVGPYTAAAIGSVSLKKAFKNHFYGLRYNIRVSPRSIAFNERVGLVDGNVIRVITR
jgi:adenine-specific DNA glycosylase